MWAKWWSALQCAEDAEGYPVLADVGHAVHRALLRGAIDLCGGGGRRAEGWAPERVEIRSGGAWGGAEDSRGDGTGAETAVGESGEHGGSCLGGGKLEMRMAGSEGRLEVWKRLLFELLHAAVKVRLI